ncbi:hypothetical protein DJ021_09455 [Phenylobacterium hankyongense]|uniref:Uncharacterized protein n=1 Tax=Phenylobacterium hankyongense TaxID=1813876 RepID=A0A328AY21_9CAUL|nr:hypothetical protein [Phenylobacterium hankyongense]RAK60012.1 hypothetical protein DJ021_09455 [Phenylobacterium hankyongense]
MSQEVLTLEPKEDVFTLLCVRADGVASVVDLVASADLPAVRRRATALLREHASCDVVEVWRDGALIEQLDRA